MPADTIAGKASIIFSANVDKLNKQFKQISGTMDSVKGKLKGVGNSFTAFGVKASNAIDRVKGIKKIGKNIKDVGSTLTTAGAKFSAPFVLAGIAGGRFQDQMATLRGLLGDISDNEFRAIEERAKELGSTTSFTATQVGEGMVSLARQTGSAESVLASIVPTLNSARAGVLELGESATLVGDTARVFRTDFAEVADIISQTANTSSQDFNDIQESLKFVGTNASNARLSLLDTAKTIALLADAGQKGSIGATGLNEALAKIVDNKNRKRFKELGVDIADSANNMREPVVVAKELQQAFADAGITGVDAQAELREIFGIRGGRAVSALFGITAEEITENSRQIDAYSGSAQTLAEIMDSRVGGAFRKALSAIEGVGVELTAVAEPAIKAVFETIREFSNDLTGFIKEWPKLSTAIGAVGFALTAFGIVLSAVGIIVISSTIGIVGLTVAFTGLKTVLGFFVGIFKGPAVAIGVMLTGLATIVDYVSQLVGFGNLGVIDTLANLYPDGGQAKKSRVLEANPYTLELIRKGKEYREQLEKDEERDRQELAKQNALKEAEKQLGTTGDTKFDVLGFFGGRGLSSLSGGGTKGVENQIKVSNGYLREQTQIMKQASAGVAT